MSLLVSFLSHIGAHYLVLLYSIDLVRFSRRICLYQSLFKTAPAQGQCLTGVGKEISSQPQSGNPARFQ